MNAPTFGAPFADYTLHSHGVRTHGGLSRVSARQLDFDAGVVEVTTAEPGPVLLATGSFTLTTPGAHSLALTPDTSRFFSVHTGSTLRSYSSLIGDSVRFAVEAGETPAVFLNVDKLQIAESGGAATITAELSQATTRDVTVDLSFAGTATQSIDYRPSSEKIVIAAGSRSGTAVVRALRDASHDPNETIMAEISGVTNAVEAGQQELTVTIKDVSAAPRDTLLFAIQTDKPRYAVDDTVEWSILVGLENASPSNFGIQSVSLDVDHSRSEELRSAAVSHDFRNYEFRGGRVSGRFLRDVGAELNRFFPQIVQVTAQKPDPVLLASGSFTVTEVGFHSLTVRPQENRFFTLGLHETAGYTTLIPSTASFVVSAGSSAGGGSGGGSGSSSGGGGGIGDTIIRDDGEPAELAGLSRSSAKKDAPGAVDFFRANVLEFLDANASRARQVDHRTTLEPPSASELNTPLMSALANWSNDDFSDALFDLGPIANTLD